MDKSPTSVVNEDQPLCCDPVIDYSMKRVLVKQEAPQLVHLIVLVTADIEFCPTMSEVVCMVIAPSVRLKGTNQ